MGVAAGAGAKAVADIGRSAVPAPGISLRPFGSSQKGPCEVPTETVPGPQAKRGRRLMRTIILAFL